LQYGIGFVDTITGPVESVDILVIDDDEIMRELVSDWLEAGGYAVRKAVDSRAALAEVERAAPALVVTDMCMPGPGGSAIIRALKRDHPATPIIAISGHFKLSGCSAEDALRMGAAQALAKPVKRAELMRAVADLVGVAVRPRGGK
jgi:DNA-binding NtrC family response regulator